MPQRTATDVAIGASAASLPTWALASQEWFVYVAAVCGGVLAVGRLIQFGVEVARKIRRRRAAS